MTPLQISCHCIKLKGIYLMIIFLYNRGILKPNKTSRMELFKTINYYITLTISAKSFILNVLLRSGYATLLNILQILI